MRAGRPAATPDQIAKLSFCQAGWASVMAGVLADRMKILPVALLDSINDSVGWCSKSIESQRRKDNAEVGRGSCVSKWHALADGAVEGAQFVDVPHVRGSAYPGRCPVLHVACVGALDGDAICSGLVSEEAQRRYGRLCEYISVASCSFDFTLLIQGSHTSQSN